MQLASWMRSRRDMAIEQQVDRAAGREVERPGAGDEAQALDEIAADMELERDEQAEREAEAAEARAIEAGAIVKLKAGGAGGPENYSPELRAQIDAARDKKSQGEENARLAKQARKDSAEGRSGSGSGNGMPKQQSGEGAASQRPRVQEAPVRQHCARAGDPAARL